MLNLRCCDVSVLAINQVDKNFWEEPLTNESSFWFGRFTRYLLAGSDRTIYTTYKQFCEERGEIPKQVVSGRWNQICRTYQWVERAKSYDVYLHKETLRLRELARQKEVEEWANRRKQAREENWQKYLDIRGKATEMLDHPLFIEKVTEESVAENGVTVKHITRIPYKWTFRDILAAEKLAYELARESTGSEIDVMQAVQVLVENNVLTDEMLIEISGSLADSESSIRNAIAGDKNNA